MNWDPIEKLAQDVSSGRVSAKDLVKRSLEQIEAKKDFNSVLAQADSALDRAEGIDKRLKNGQKAGRLAGVPFVAKDNFLTKDVETTASSNILGGFHPPYSSTAVNKLEAEGAILVGKANLDAFAHGSSTEMSDFGPTKNPHDPARVPGGSSGGSAAAVVLGIAPFAIGTDTGGSVRLPASFCGAVGLKPTYGLVSRYGVVAMASSTDVIGPITRTVADSALILDVMSGRDEHDSTTIERDPKPYTELDQELKGLSFGVIKENMGEGVDKHVRNSINTSIKHIEAAGGVIKEVSLPSQDLALAAYYIIVPAEISSNLSRYDGIRFGYSHEDATTVDEMYDLSRSFGFNDENKRRIIVGTYVLSSGYYDAYYKKAQAVRTLIVNDYNRAFESVDFLIGPTSPTVAFKFGANVTDPLKMYLADIMTVGANLSGVPAINVPVAKDGALPIGLQLSGPQRSDRSLLGVAQSIEKQAGYERL